MACAARVAEVWPDDNDGAIANQLRVLFAVERSPPPDTCGMRVAQYRAADRGLSVRRLLPRVARSHSLSPGCRRIVTVLLSRTGPACVISVTARCCHSCGSLTHRTLSPEMAPL